MGLARCPAAKGQRFLRDWPAIHMEASDDSLTVKKGCQKGAGFASFASKLFAVRWPL